MFLLTARDRVPSLNLNLRVRALIKRLGRGGTGQDIFTEIGYLHSTVMLAVGGRLGMN